MAQTGKLGTVDSLLANVQPAFVIADPTPPTVTGASGRLGEQLGDTILALGGVIGAIVVHVSAESVLFPAQTADPAPTFAPHAPPFWTLGGQDSQLGDTGLAFAGADGPPPAITTQDGRLGGQLGDLVPGLGGMIGAAIIRLSAETALTIAQWADPDPTFVPHSSPAWVLGGRDAQPGVMQPAFAGAEDARPATGDHTGQLGTLHSLLGNMRPALGEQEGGGGETIVYGTALTALALSSNADAGIARGCVVSHDFVVTDAADVGTVRNREVTSDLTVLDSACGTAVRDIVAGDVLELADTALGAAVFAVAVQSVADLTVEADTSALRSLAATDTLELTDEAARTALIAVGAESAIEPATAADAATVRAVTATSALDLVDEAARTSRTIWTLAVESAISLESELGVQISLGLGVASPLGLVDTASRNVLRTLDAQSAVDPSMSAVASAVRPTAAISPVVVADTAAGHKIISSAIESATSLEFTASVSATRSLSATSAIDLTDIAAGGTWLSADVEVWDWLPIWGWAEVAVVRGVAAANTIALSQADQTARPWNLSAESAVQTVAQEYDPQLGKLVTRLEGLQDAAAVARPLAAAASQAIALGQSAIAVRVKPTAIEVSAESVLELLGEIRPNQTGDTGNWLSLAQTAAVDKCKTTKSALALSGRADITRSGPRGAASTLALRQSATFSIVFSGVRQQYHPFVGEGTPGTPTPPPATLGPPAHTGLPFRLFYPASGTVTDSVTLRAPNLGNKDRLSFNRILRETRGGTLVVFADPIWPKIQTLVLTFSGLSAMQSRQLLAFLETHLGEEIGLLDWEGRCWKGVVMTPTEPVVQDDRNSYSASLEFEGELVPA